VRSVSDENERGSEMSIFKDGFLWGGSASSMQSEGGWDKGGKGLTTYDVRETTHLGSDWKVAVDFYHRYKEDIALMAEMGFSAYRFSLSWARILPDGEGELNEEGLQFYDNVINELLKHQIEPIVCFHHFDLPVALMEKYLGWYGRETLNGFKKFAKVIIKRFGKRVQYYIPFNEQNAAAMIQNVYAPETFSQQEKDLYQAVCTHHMFLASASVSHLVREHAPHAQVGGMVNFMPVYPATCRPEDVLSAYKGNRAYNYQTLDVLFHGEYPDDLLAEWRQKNCLPAFEKADLDYLKETKMDFLAHSYYQSATIRAGQEITGTSILLSLFQAPVKNEYLQTTDWGWAIDPIGLRLSVKELYTRYQLPIFPIECGIGVVETLNEEKTVDDHYRIEYFRTHLEELKLAVKDDGVKLMGFLTWGPIDILSSQGEMRKRYGFVYVNRTDTELLDLNRYKKKSFDWFKDVISSNGEIL